MNKVKQFIIWIFINICVFLLVLLFFWFTGQSKLNEMEKYHKQRMSEEQQQQLKNENRT